MNRRGFLGLFGAVVAAPFVPSASGARRLLEVSHVAHRMSASEEYVRRLIREGKLRI